MNTYDAALWSSSFNSRYRTTHHQLTKQHGMEEQRVQNPWTWEDILAGKGPWRQAGEYCRPKKELEAAKAERRRFEASERSRHERQPPNCLGGGGTRGDWRSQAIDLSQLPVLTGSSMVLVRHSIMR
jgi:hypothetical protein